MSDYTLTQTFQFTPYQVQSMLYLGQLDQTVYEAYRLYHELVMFARFDRPMSELWLDDPIRLTYAYALYRLIIMSILPFYSAYPISPKTRFSSDLNRHIEVGRYRVF